MSGDELPKTNAEIVKLAEYARDRPPERKLDDDALTFVSYLLTHGFGRLRVRNVVKPVWPEAAAHIKLKGADACRAILSVFEDRVLFCEMLETCVKKRHIGDFEHIELLEEWDALHFPSQLPAPIRERALRRHRFAIGESDEP